MIIGIAATPSVAAKSMSLYKGVAKIQKNSQSIAVNATKSLSPTIVLSTITTTTNSSMETGDNMGILKAIEEDLEKSEAVKDAKINARLNNADNVEVYKNDAGRFMKDMAAKKEKLDVLFMDPPRSGASEEFLSAALELGPAKIVYISCEPTTLARDLAILTEGGYEMKKAVPVDMFPYTEGVETVVLLSKK